MEADGAALSLRDPQGQLLALGDRLFRLISKTAAPLSRDLLGGSRLDGLRDKGLLVPWSILDAESLPATLWPRARIAPEETGLVLEHPRVWFPSYPTEWAPEMLYAAGKFTLQLMRELHRQKLWLKDASPYNVLFDGSRPRFCDHLSIEERPALQGTWSAAGQFLRCFVNPLLAHRHCETPTHGLFWLNRDGIEADAIYAMLGHLRRWHPSLFFSVTLPTWLNRGLNQVDAPNLYRGLVCNSAEKADFVLGHLIDRLEARLDRLAPAPKKPSVWMRYMESGYSFTDAQLAEKEAIVQSVLNDHRPTSVLDVGCNTGHFSRMAAAAGARVVAVDYDPQVVGQVWRTASEKHQDILPLVVNFARPTPGLGWRNCENTPFLERAEKKFDGLFMLATLHHLTITEGIPLSEVLALAGRLVKRWCLVEYISPNDKAFRGLCRGRDFSHLTPEYFEAQARQHFHIHSRQTLRGSERTLYLLEPLTSR